MKTITLPLEEYESLINKVARDQAYYDRAMEKERQHLQLRQKEYGRLINEIERNGTIVNECGFFRRYVVSKDVELIKMKKENDELRERINELSRPVIKEQPTKRWWHI